MLSAWQLVTGKCQQVTAARHQAPGCLPGCYPAILMAAAAQWILPFQCTFAKSSIFLRKNSCILHEGNMQPSATGTDRASERQNKKESEREGERDRGRAAEREQVEGGCWKYTPAQRTAFTIIFNKFICNFVRA